MASKKLYEEIASALRDLALAPSDREIIAAALCEPLKNDNSRFDVGRFLEAVRPADGPKCIDASALVRLAIDYGVEVSRGTPGLPSLRSVFEIACDSVSETVGEKVTLDG